MILESTVQTQQQSIVPNKEKILEVEKRINRFYLRFENLVV